MLGLWPESPQWVINTLPLRDVVHLVVEEEVRGAQRRLPLRTAQGTARQTGLEYHMSAQGTSSKKVVRRHRGRAIRQIPAAVCQWLRSCLLALWRITVLMIRRIGRGLVIVVRWSGRGLIVTARTLDPLLCFVCIGVGVLLTLPLPALLWGGIVPVLKQIRNIPLTAFPVAQMPAGISLQTALQTALPLALAVFRRHYYDWRDSPAPLMAKLLFAMYAGVCWPRAWWPQRQPLKPRP